MKMITAIIKPYRLDDVLGALDKIGILGLTATEVKGYGQQKGQIDPELSSGRDINFLPKVKLEIAAPDEKVSEIVETIQSSAETGKIGDGKIFVLSLEKTIRIRTGEEDRQAV